MILLDRVPLLYVAAAGERQTHGKRRVRLLDDSEDEIVRADALPRVDLDIVAAHSRLEKVKFLPAVGAIVLQSC